MAAQGFTVQLAAFAEKAKGNKNAVVRKVLLQMGTSLVMKSPVGDALYWVNQPPPKGYVGGRFRANWQFGEGAIDYTTTTAVDPSGEKAVGGLLAKLPDEPSGKVYYITNSLAYSQRLEDGWSHRQAPNGMVALTVLEFRNYLSQAVAELK